MVMKYFHYVYDLICKDKHKIYFAGGHALCNPPPTFARLLSCI